MRDVLIPGAGLVAGVLLLIGAQATLADDPGAGITVEPDQVTAGQTLLLAGKGLEPDDERILVLQGEHLAVSLGTATTDADGMLATEVTIPGHLPSGSYQLQAIGDETLQVEVKVEAAAGATVADETIQEAPASGRSGFETIAVIVSAAGAAALGVVLIRGAEKLGSGRTA